MKPLHLSLCLLAAAAAASCGGGGDGGATTPSAATTPLVTATPAPAVSPAPATTGGIAAPLATTIASEGGSFTVTGTQTVNYGAGTAWISKAVSGLGDCTNGFFGSDPSPGVVKTCQVATATSQASAPALIVPIVATDSLMPVIDVSKIPAPVAGYASDRVKVANAADPSQNPAVSDNGGFREYCEFSHMSYADPIVAPGSVGGHLHTFFGNTGTDGNSTAQSLANSGNSTCAGGTLNRTAYWFPTMIDTRDGTPLKPIGSLIYYKQGYLGVAAASIKPFPAGLRMVAGNAASSGIQDAITSFTCFKPDGTWTTGSAIPTTCPAGSNLTLGVAFPQCWDGVNLDSPDHKSHMAYARNGCPSTHPVPLTGITFNINYSVVEANATGRWRLSSDNYDKSLPGGYSSHADWFNGWNADILAVWTARCINASMDCHAFLIGDGRILY